MDNERITGVIRESLQALSAYDGEKQENDTDEQASERLSLKMEEMFAREEKKRNSRRILGIIVKTAGIAATACVVLFVFLFAVSPTVRAGVMAWTKGDLEVEAAVEMEDGSRRTVTMVLPFIPADLTMRKDGAGDDGEFVILASGGGDRWLKVSFLNGFDLRNRTEGARSSEQIPTKEVPNAGPALLLQQEGAQLSAVVFTEDGLTGILLETNLNKGELYSVLRQMSLRSRQ